MMISKSLFMKELKNAKGRKHSIIFLGMSSCGKTHWSKLLSEKFHLNHIEFDDIIGESEEFKEPIKNILGATKA